MQTIHLNVKDGYMQNVMALLGSIQDVMIDKIEVDSDPYFEERKEQLHKLRDDVRSGKEKMYDFDKSMDELLLEVKS